jgi:hypothetical protein
MDALIIRVLVQLMTFIRSCRPAPDVSHYLAGIKSSTALFCFTYVLCLVVVVVVVVVVQNITNSFFIKVPCVIKVFLYNIESTGC